MPFILTKIGADSDVLDYASTVNVSSWRSDIAPFVRGCPNPVIDSEVIEACREFCKETRLWKKKLQPIDIVAVQAEDIAFVSGDPATITSTTTDFTDVLGDGTGVTFEEGMTIVTYNTDDNNRELLLDSVDTNTLTLVSGEHVDDESAGNNVLVSAVGYPLSSASGDIAEIIEVQYDDNIPLDLVGEEYLKEHDPGWRETISAEPTMALMGQDRTLRIIYAPQEALEGELVVRAVMMPLRSATAVQGFLYHDYFYVIKNLAIAKLLEIPNMAWSNDQKSLLHRSLYESTLNDAYNRGQRGYAKVSQNIGISG